MEKYRALGGAERPLLCVGLDPLPERFPAYLRASELGVLAFNRAIIDATAPYAEVYKPQFAHYAALGALELLAATMAYLRDRYPEKIVILDAKRGDIGSTAERYALEAFQIYGADAVTVNPYMGGDTLEPFSKHADKGVVVLCKTSNPGSGDLQDLVQVDGRPLYQHVAEKAVRQWNGHGNLALVVGATYPDEVRAVRQIVGDMPLLIPGIGAQGGDLAAVLAAGRTAQGGGLMMNSSRGILYASAGEDFSLAAAAEAQKLAEALKA